MKRFQLTQAWRDADNMLWFKRHVVEAKSRAEAIRVGKSTLDHPQDREWFRADLTEEIKEAA